MSRRVLRRRVILGSAIVVLVVLLVVTSLWTRAQGPVQLFTVPVTRTLNSWSLSLGALFNGPQLQRENNELRQRLAQLKAYESERDTLHLENEHLRNLTEVPLPSGWQPLGVEVIGRQQDETGTNYIINRGATSGLIPGLALVAGISASANTKSRLTAVMVGIVKSVGREVSIFSSLTSAQSQILAEVVNTSQSQGLAVGEYNLAVRLKFIPLNDELTTGQPVVTSNLASLIPSGLLLGSITAVDRPSGDFFQSAVVATPWPLDKLRFLYVLLPTSPSD